MPTYTEIKAELIEMCKVLENYPESLKPKVFDLLLKSYLGVKAKDVQGEVEDDAGESSYPNVLALEDESVQILKDIPGDGKKEQTVNAALLHLLGSELINKTEATSEEIRQVCETHDCLDHGNFAAYLTSGKGNLIFSGRGKSRKVKLSAPGRKAAKKLAKELNEEDEG